MGAANVSDPDIELKIIRNYNDAKGIYTLPEIIYSSMPSCDMSIAEQKEEHKIWLRILDAAIIFQNALSRIDNTVYDDIELDISSFYPVLTGLDGYIVIYDKDNVPVRRMYSSLVDGNIILDSLEPGLYTIDCFSNDMMVLHLLVYQMSDTDFRAYRYDNICMKVGEQEQIEEQAAVLSSSSSLDYNQCLSYQYMKSCPINNVVLPAPVISVDPFMQITAVFQNYGLIEKMPEPVYLVMAEQDCIGTDMQFLRKIQITDKEMKLDRSDCCFNHEPYYFYIATENNIILSSVSYCNIMDPDDISQETLNNQEVIDRITRISRQLSYDVDTEMKRAALLSLDAVSSDSTIYSLIHNGFLNYIQDHRNQDALFILQSFFRDKVFHEQTDFSLFTNANIRPQWKVVDFPVLNSQYIVEVFGYSHHSDSVKYAYYLSSDTATTIRYDTDDYMAFTVFNCKTGDRIGGYLLFDNTKDRLTYMNYQLDVQVRGD